MKKTMCSLLMLGLFSVGVSAAEKVILTEGFDSVRLPTVRISVSKDYQAKFNYFPKIGNKKPGARGLVLPNEIIPKKSIGFFTVPQKLDQNKSYIFRVFIKPDKKCTSGSLSLTVRPRDAKKNWMWNAKPWVKKISLSSLPTDKWTKFEYEFKTRPEDKYWQKAEYFVPICGINNAGGITLYIDDVELIEK